MEKILDLRKGWIV